MPPSAIIQDSAPALNRHGLSPQLYYASVKRTKCVTINVSLVAEAEEAAARLGTTFSALVEEALRRLLRQAEAWRGVEEKLTNIETLLRRCLKETRSRRRRRGRRP
jgi:post-segregation antitoxin (ccd killing protein)